jgi:acetyl esterase/lipase
MPRPPCDPELKPVLDLIVENTAGHLELARIDENRAAAGAMCPPIESVIDGHDLEHVEVSAPGHAGSPDVTLSIIRRPGNSYPVPCIYNIHGGGMYLGNRFFEAKEFVGWVEKFGVTVVSVEYRLAPEHPHPAPVSDCYAGLAWVAEHDADIGIDPHRILIAGGSAGGGLAAAVALMARDREGPHLIGQLLNCPMLDDRNKTISSRQYDDPDVWNRATNIAAWSFLLGDSRDTDDVSPYAAPARAKDLGGLPPAFIAVGSAEVFRDEAVEYASRIWAAGGQAELHVWSGGFHGFEILAAHTSLAQAAKTARYNWMSRVLKQ